MDDCSQSQPSPGDGLDGLARASSSSAAADDFHVKEEPMSEDEMKAFHKDRQKKDNHNMSKGNRTSRVFC
jgi:hypothetical protein